MKSRILRSTLAVLVAAMTLAGTAATAGPAAAATPADGHSRPDVYVVPGTAVFPEGSAADQRTGTFWISSINGGAVYRGTVDDPTLELFLPAGGDGRDVTVGLEYARGVLYVAGGPSGQVWAYNAYSGALLARLSTGVANGFVNDIAIGRDGAAYVTDSFQPFLYRVARTRDGSWSLERWLDLSETVPHIAGAFNVNGIAASPDGRFLFIVNSATGGLYRIDIRTKGVLEVDVHGADLTGGDGLEARGSTLYVVRNAAREVVRLQLVARGRHAYVTKTITDPSFRFPTTAEVLRGRLLVVNSQLDRLLAGQPAETPFTVTAVRL